MTIKPKLLSDSALADYRFGHEAGTIWSNSDVGALLAHIAALEAQIAEAAADLAVREEAHAAFVSAQSEQLVEAEDHTAEQIAAWIESGASRSAIPDTAAAQRLAGAIRADAWRTP